MSMICLPVLVIILLVLSMHSVVIGFFRSLYCLYNFSYTKCVCCWLSWRKSCLGLRILCPLTSVVIPRSRSYIFACVYFCWCWLFIHPFYQGLVGTNACMFVYIFRHIICHEFDESLSNFSLFIVGSNSISSSSYFPSVTCPLCGGYQWYYQWNTVIYFVSSVRQSSALIKAKMGAHLL